MDGRLLRLFLSLVLCSLEDILEVNAMPSPKARIELDS